MVLPAHGGQPRRIIASFNIEEKGRVYDFSANINPLGPPAWLSARLPQLMEEVEHYPDPSYLEANSSLARQEGVDKEQVLLTNGGAEAIFLTAQLFQGRTALIIDPTFSEYERACQAFDVTVTRLTLDDRFYFPVDEMVQVLPEVDVVFLCRPNNPTGSVLPINDVEYLLKLGLKTGTTIVVDEAFVHFLMDEEASVQWLLAAYSNLIILRSLTKIFALPGLRAGYVMASENCIKKLQSKQPTWSVNGITAALLPALLTDEEYMKETKKWLDGELGKLAEKLTSLDFTHTISSINFYLLRDEARPQDMDELFRFLVEHHIIPRHTDNFLGLNGQYLRLAVRSSEENDHLLHVLRKWREQKC
ncbi:threonine-phosphate decarboxylase CobD [Halobacillus sp. Marseille-Q1614]|uniref:threonine-phosphate decarboxylase CobD n=1 Tax=Halobacillus sp. Marseille-Q1614 TaxID=2709134 RepID=UPI001570981C|nr:threonine-phosphate decarboxylase CobD [Halobacillus sp. Marseille-Q1614]